MSISLNSSLTNMFKFVSIFLTIFLLQCAFRAPYILDVGYLNDDSGLILQSVDTISNDGFLNPFHSKPQEDGPKMLRPLQTISTYFEYTLIPDHAQYNYCLLYTSPSPRDATLSRMPSSA